MTRFILGILLGVLLSATLAWPWGHTTRDQLQRLNDQIERDRWQDTLDRAFQGPRLTPCP